MGTEAVETLNEHDYMIALKGLYDSQGREHCNNQTETRRNAGMFHNKKIASLCRVLSVYQIPC